LSQPAGPPDPSGRYPARPASPPPAGLYPPGRYPAGAAPSGPPPNYPPPAYQQPGYPAVQQQFGQYSLAVPPGYPSGPGTMDLTSQVASHFQLASPWKRLGASALEVVLDIFTLGIGYLIWTLVVWGKGKTPAKQVLGMTVVDARTGRPATWGHMFVRQFLVQGLFFGLFGALTVGILWVVAAAMIFGANYQTLWDRMAKTLVVNDR